MRNRLAELLAVSARRNCFGVWAVCDGSGAINLRDMAAVRPDSGVSVCRKRTASKDLQQIVRQADQVPFAPHLLKAAEHELPEPAAVFDLAEGWFDNRLAACVFGAAFLGPQLAGHLLLHREVFGQTAFRSVGHSFVMFQTASGDVRFVDVVIVLQGRHVLFAEVTSIGGERMNVFFDTNGVQVFHGLGDHRLNLTRIVRLISDVGRDDDLLFVSDRLRVAALIKSLVRRLHDLRLGVREVPLILRVGNRLGEILPRRSPLCFKLRGVVGRLSPGTFFQRRFGLADLL